MSDYTLIHVKHAACIWVQQLLHALIMCVYTKIATGLGHQDYPGHLHWVTFSLGNIGQLD